MDKKDIKIDDKVIFQFAGYTSIGIVVYYRDEGIVVVKVITSINENNYSYKNGWIPTHEKELKSIAKPDDRFLHIRKKDLTLLII